MAEIDWNEYFKLSKEAECPEDIKRLYQNPPLKTTNLMNLPEDVLNKIGGFIKNEDKAFRKTNKKIKNEIIDFLDKNGAGSNNRKYLRFMDNELYDKLQSIIDDRMKDINKERVEEYYYDETKPKSLYNTYKKITNTEIYLNISYEDKDHAKLLGAKWDKDERKWYGYIYNKELMNKYFLYKE